MTATRWVQIGLVLLIASGCTQRADWIGGTLVTVDVTGQWVGSYSGPGPSGNVEMILRQTGPRTTGDVRLAGGSGSSTAAHFFSGPIEGTVSGDVLKFNRPDGQLRGEVIVAGDEMSGTVTFGVAARGRSGFSGTPASGRRA